MNFTQMMRMLEYASAAYRDNQPECCHGEPILVENTATDTECFVRKGDHALSVTFRGTDSLTNWVHNFMAAMRSVPYNEVNPEIRVHSGFLETYRSVREQILSLVPQGDCRILITGHSLGAALAVLCAVDIVWHFPHKDVEVYLFGCPRVGNKAFAKSYDKRVFKTLRVTCGNDVVAKLPPTLLGYRHVGIPIHTGMLSLPLVISFADHRMQTYYAKLWKGRYG